MFYCSEISQINLLSVIERYIQLFPEERGRADIFARFVMKFDGEELISRKNFIGHLTASAMIYDIATDSFLLLKHRALGLWLQPGGHVDPSDKSLIDTAMREVWEETGLREGEYCIALFSDDGFPVFELDSHFIPSNMAKMETAHIHHDVRFLFCLSERRAIKISRKESDGYEWFQSDKLPEGFSVNVVRSRLSLVR